MRTDARSRSASIRRFQLRATTADTLSSQRGLIASTVRFLPSFGPRHEYLASRAVGPPMAYPAEGRSTGALLP
jgi:hypothetical protein